MKPAAVKRQQHVAPGTDNLPSPDRPNTAWAMLFAAWAVALVATLSAIFIGEIMGQTPCLLCWFQRAFMFPLAVVLGIATYRSDIAAWRYGGPLAMIGWLIAAYHVLVYFELTPKSIVPCGAGPSCADAAMTVFGWVPIPLLSLGSFSLILAFLYLARRRHEYA